MARPIKLIGTAVGIAGIFALVHVKTKDPVCLDEEGAGILLSGALVGTGIGALVCEIVEESIRGDRLHYRARFYPFG